MQFNHIKCGLILQPYLNIKYGERWIHSPPQNWTLLAQINQILVSSQKCVPCFQWGAALEACEGGQETIEKRNSKIQKMLVADQLKVDATVTARGQAISYYVQHFIGYSLLLD